MVQLECVACYMYFVLNSVSSANSQELFEGSSSSILHFIIQGKGFSEKGWILNWLWEIYLACHLYLYVTLHGKTGKKVNARARLFDTLNNRQRAKWHASVWAVCHLARLIKNKAETKRHIDLHNRFFTGEKTLEPTYNEQSNTAVCKMARVKKN